MTFVLEENECRAGLALCQHLCIDAGSGYNCACRTGFKLEGRYKCTGKFAHNGYVNKVYAITVNRNTAISYHLFPCVLASPVINMWAYRLPFPRVFARLRHAEEDVD